jgi:hypothetical protein
MEDDGLCFTICCGVRMVLLWEGGGGVLPKLWAPRCDFAARKIQFFPCTHPSLTSVLISHNLWKSSSQLRITINNGVRRANSKPCVWFPRYTHTVANNPLPSGVPPLVQQRTKAAPRCVFSAIRAIRHDPKPSS